jgi:hypothetical protein
LGHQRRHVPLRLRYFRIENMQRTSSWFGAVAPPHSLRLASNAEAFPVPIGGTFFSKVFSWTGLLLAFAVVAGLAIGH